MKGYISRRFVVLALGALSVILVVQVAAFILDYSRQEAEFAERVNIALRSVADALLAGNHDATSEIPPLTRTSSNTYFISLDKRFKYAALDSIIRNEFIDHGVDLPFRLAIYDRSNSVTLGNFYKEGAAASAEADCVGRNGEAMITSFSVTFPAQKAMLVGALDLWIFSGITLALIVVAFIIVVTTLRKEKDLAVLRNDFINNMTHELQTPIANISMASEVLRKNASIDNERRMLYLGIIEEENSRLKRHVTRVLDNAALEKHELPLQKGRVDLHHIIHQVVLRFSIRVQQAGGTIATDLQATDPVVSGDPLHLSNVFSNLVENAAKYSRHHPEIVVRSRDAGARITITVEDSGIGMSSEAREMIFEKFYRVPSGDVHNVTGFGLGLSYVKRIVNEHSGRIEVRSELNKGSLFSVTLPRIYSAP